MTQTSPMLRPFAGLRPVAGRASEVIAPPYDVLSSEEARRLATGRPWSFLHISKPEIDLPPGTDPYSAPVYAKARENLETMIAAGVLVRDDSPCLYVYRLRMGAHVQTGLVAAASVAAYDANLIRKHEFTRPDKEDDRVRQIEALDAQTGPVLLAHTPDAALAAEVAAIAGGTPDVDVTAHDGVVHQLWVVRDAAWIARATARFGAEDGSGAIRLYIADGHHRSAAASRVAARRGDARSGFLTVLFPADQMRILDYNRLVRDLNGLSEAAFLEAIAGAFSVSQSGTAVSPRAAGEFGMFLAGRWYRLRLRDDLVRPADPVAALDVSLLADHLLAPVLGIHDARRDKRIDFVGGIRGLGELEARVRSGEMAVAFSMCPTSLDQLMAVADTGQVMPPKSTWFEPKLADGLISLVLD